MKTILSYDPVAKTDMPFYVVHMDAGRAFDIAEAYDPPNPKYTRFILGGVGQELLCAGRLDALRYTAKYGINDTSP